MKWRWVVEAVEELQWAAAEWVGGSSALE